MKPQMRTNRVSSQTMVPLDAETMRLADLQMEFLDLVGIHMGPEQLKALAAAARVRLAAE